MKRLLHWILCLFGRHEEWTPSGLINNFQGLRVDFYTCRWCGKKKYSVVEVDYR